MSGEVRSVAAKVYKAGIAEGFANRAEYVAGDHRFANSGFTMKKSGYVDEREREREI